MRSFYIQRFNLLYIDCSDLIVNVYISILNLNIDVNTVSSKDLRKLIFHFIVRDLLKRKGTKNKRPVYYFDKKFLLEFTDKKYIESFIFIIKHLKSLLPVPLILIDNDKIFNSKNGDIIGLSEKISHNFINSKKSTIKLRKYLENEEFYELIKALSDIKNIKHLST